VGGGSPLGEIPEIGSRRGVTPPGEKNESPRRGGPQKLFRKGLPSLKEGGGDGNAYLDRKPIPRGKGGYHFFSEKGGLSTAGGGGEAVFLLPIGKGLSREKGEGMGAPVVVMSSAAGTT